MNDGSGRGYETLTYTVSNGLAGLVHRPQSKSGDTTNVVST